MTQYKLLPSEPTDEMIDIGNLAYYSSASSKTDLRDAYIAMWQTAPEVEPVQTLEELEQEIYENTQLFIPHNVMQWMLKRYRNHASAVEQDIVAWVKFDIDDQATHPQIMKPVLVNSGFVCRFDGFEWRDDRGFEFTRFTHWMPLPEFKEEFL
jgi:hypothetical protein